MSRVAFPALTGGAEILFGKCVNGVKSKRPRELANQIDVCTLDGCCYTFDGVVITAPLGWLKQNLSIFSPSLPPRVSDSIKALGVCQFEKIYIDFPRAFWRDESSTNWPTSYITWLKPRYACTTNPRQWPQEALDLSCANPPHNRPTLLFYTYAECAIYIAHSIHEMTESEKFTFLRTFFQPYYSKLPGYKQCSYNCHPRAILATEWSKDELSGFSSYSNFQAGISAADEDIIAIRDGCPDRRIWFCGEHAAPFEECGTVAGAYLSGEAVAEQVVKALLPFIDA